VGFVFRCSEYRVVVVQTRGNRFLYERESDSARLLLQRLRHVSSGHRGDPEVWHHGEVASRLPVQSPYVSIANRQTEIMIGLRQSSGSHASRSRIAAPPNDEDDLFSLIRDERAE
jgi:hypothetical protein